MSRPDRMDSNALNLRVDKFLLSNLYTVDAPIFKILRLFYVKSWDFLSVIFVSSTILAWSFRKTLKINYRKTKSQLFALFYFKIKVNLVDDSENL